MSRFAPGDLIGVHHFNLVGGTWRDFEFKQPYADVNASAGALVVAVLPPRGPTDGMHWSRVMVLFSTGPLVGRLGWVYLAQLRHRM